MFFTEGKEENYTSSQEAELKVIREGIKAAKNPKINSILLCSDSLVCIDAANGHMYNLLWNLTELVEEIIELKSHFVFCKLLHVPMKCLQLVDILAVQTRVKGLIVQNSRNCSIDKASFAFDVNICLDYAMQENLTPMSLSYVPILGSFKNNTTV